MNVNQNYGIANYQLRNNNNNTNFKAVKISGYLQEEISKELVNPSHREKYLARLKRRLDNMPINLTIQNIVVQAKRKAAYIQLICKGKEQIITVCDGPNRFGGSISESKMDILEHLLRRGKKGSIRLQEDAYEVFPYKSVAGK